MKSAQKVEKRRGSGVAVLPGKLTDCESRDITVNEVFLVEGDSAGGSAKMEGAIELAEEVFHMPVRLGVPQFVEGLSDVVRNPIHATGVGLLLYSRQAQAAKAESQGGKLGVTSAFERMKAWFQKNF